MHVFRLTDLNPRGSNAMKAHVNASVCKWRQNPVLNPGWSFSTCQQN